MRFWDSSALVPLFVEQERSLELRSWVLDDDDVIVWRLSEIEVRSGFARLVREGTLDMAALQAAAEQFEAMLGRGTVVDTVTAVIARAKRLLLVHGLRAADALQLGAALTACKDDPAGFEFLCLDARLCDAARREGFVVRP